MAVKLLSPVYTIQPVVKPIDNRLYRVYRHSTGYQTHLTTGLRTGCQTGWTVAVHSTRLSNRFDNRVERTDCSFNAVVKPVWQRDLTTGWTNSGCSFNTVVKPVVKGCLFTRYNQLSGRLYNRFDNWLYSVNGYYVALVQCVHDVLSPTSRCYCLKFNYLERTASDAKFIAILKISPCRF